MTFTKQQIRKAIFAMVLVITATGLWAQPGGGGGGQGGGGPPPSGTGGPIDGGAVMLLIGAAGYTYKQLKKEKENS